MAVLLGTFALLASGCQLGGSGSTGPGNLRKDQIFHFNLRTGGSGNIKGLDPDTVTSFTSAEVQYLIYDGLVTLDSNLNVEKWGASSYSVSSDGLTYTFHLRSGQKFSDGTPVTSADYAYGIDRSVNPCLASPVSYYLTGQAGQELIKDSTKYNSETCTNGVITGSIQTLIGDSINTPDPQTLTVTLKQPAVYFLAAMSYPTSFAIEKSVVNASGDISNSKWTDTLSQGSATGQGTSGMFYVSSWDKSSGRMVLKKNPHWWGTVKYLTEIDFTFFKDTDTAYAAYQSGQFENVGIPAAQVPAARSMPDFHQVGLLQVEGYDFQWKTPPFDNLDARIAFCLAINRTSLNHSVFKDAQSPSWSLVPPGMPGYNPNVTGPDNVKDPAGDQAKAATHWQTYLSTAGSKAVKTVDFKYVTGSAAAQQYAEGVQQQIQTVLPGVTVKLDPIDANTWYGILTSGDYVMTDWGWIDDYPDPQDFLTLLYSSSAQYNVQHATVPDADTLMLKADADSNQTTRIQAYNQAEQLLINNVANCPLYTAKGYYQVRQYVHGFVETAGGFVSNDNWAGMYLTNS